MRLRSHQADAQPSRLEGVSYRDVDVRLFGEVALLHGVFEAIGSGGAARRVRYTDNDRAMALANFAQPTFATRMKSFPVDEVQIRRFGDIALIHAQNAYELKDGRTGISRYTDVWQKKDGRWQCILAHINVNKAPG